MSILLEKRLERLEETASESIERFVTVISAHNETSEDCIRRYGHDPNAQGVKYFVLRFISPPN
ncbi:MAG: hypothetical protein COW02_01610 [Comamonadaceae bacterium CG12_big_fil_rev_8_21_14_0_65_59_15]|nr:MAG: hypothetical protein COW02_01610 [Comamonadaceae bacterium CG12_big_fil_rev_8_21_14_0_65_59_15]